MTRSAVRTIVLVVLAVATAFLPLAGMRLWPWSDGGPALAASTTSQESPATQLDAVVGNPFGLLISAPDMSAQRKVELAKELGVAYYRTTTALTASTWDGTCPECDAAQQAGLKLILTVRATPRPTRPPEDLAAYQRQVGAILDKYHPEVLVVENEQNSVLFYVGTPAQYGQELKAACDVARGKAIACTDGGLTSRLVALLTYAHYLAKGEPARACAYAWRTFGDENPALAQLLCKARKVADLPRRVQEEIRRGRNFLEQQKGAGIDYANFHWYFADPVALGETVSLLRDRMGVPVLTNEVGQYDVNPLTPPRLLNKMLDLGLPYAIWYSADSPRARALINPDGSLRPNGVAFKRFMEAHFP